MNPPKFSGQTSHKLVEALDQAQNIIAAAEERASKLIEEATRRYDEAEERGYLEGVKRGRKEVSDKALRLIEDTGSLGSRLAQEAAHLALAISAKVIAEHVRVEPETVKRIALGALRESVIGENVTFIVNPEDSSVLEHALPEFKRIAGSAPVLIQCDPSISRGGCIVRTEFGDVDASVECLLEGVATRLGLHGNG